MIVEPKRKGAQMNKNLFQSNPGNVKDADTTNEAGGRAYQLSDKEALCQYVLTGTLNNTFYTRAEDQLKTLIELCGKVEYEFIAKLAIYARQNGRMKDTPAFLIAYLAAGAKSDIVRAALFQQAFPRVIDNAKMLRNFMTVIRSGDLGRIRPGFVRAAVRTGDQGQAAARIGEPEIWHWRGASRRRPSCERDDPFATCAGGSACCCFW